MRERLETVMGERERERLERVMGVRERERERQTDRETDLSLIHI